MLREQKYVNDTLGSNERLVVRYVTDSRRGKPARVVRFYVRYQTLIDGRICDIVEFDNCHGGTHLHYYSRDGTKGKAGQMTLGLDASVTLHDIIALFKSGLQARLKEWYLHR